MGENSTQRSRKRQKGIRDKIALGLKPLTNG